MEIYLIIAAILFCIAVVLERVYSQKQNAFVKEYSEALRRLDEINSKYTFLPVPNFDMTHKYDNRNYYSTISPGDYLAYQLVYKKTEIAKAIDDAAQNYEKMKVYRREIDSTCMMGKFESAREKENLSKIDQVLRNYWLSKGLEKICNIEKKQFNSRLKNPVTGFRIAVYIYLTDIQGRTITYKSAYFYAPEILETIKRIKSKDNGRFEDPNLWQAITRVERGKVSNRIRFAVYKRDGNRCRKCGSTWNLEVDHIYPISKGGKTTFDNLQTLCHNCNAQ